MGKLKSKENKKAKADKSSKKVEKIEEAEESQENEETEETEKEKKAEESTDREVSRMLGKIEELRRALESANNLIALLTVIDEMELVELLTASLAYLKYRGTRLNKLLNKGGLVKVGTMLYGDRTVLAKISKQFAKSGKFEVYRIPALNNSCPVGILAEYNMRKLAEIDLSNHEKVLEFVDTLDLSNRNILKGLRLYKNFDEKKSYRTRVVNAWVLVFERNSSVVVPTKNALFMSIDALKKYEEKRNAACELIGNFAAKKED